VGADQVVRLRLEGERGRIAPAAQLDVVRVVLAIGRVGREQVRQPRPERIALGLELAARRSSSST